MYVYQLMGSGAVGVFMVFALSHVKLDHKVEVVAATVHLHYMVVQLVLQLVSKEDHATLTNVQIMGTGGGGMTMVAALKRVVME
jgi:hypothetical protein